MAIFKGAGVAIVTPMYDDGKVNYDKLEELLEYQIANSTDAIIICGTTGESSTMTHGEHLKTIKFAIDKVNKRVPVIAGTGSNCTETAIMMHLTPNLCLYDPYAPGLEGVAEELFHCGFEGMNITFTSDIKEALTGAKYVVSSGGAARKAGMTREDLLKGNAAIAEEFGKNVKAYCPDVKHVVVIFNPADITGLITLLYSGLKPSQVTTLAALDSTRLRSELSKHFGIAPDKIENCRTYGGHGEQMAVYASTAKVDGKPLLDIIGTPALTKEQWVEIQTKVTKGGANIIALRGRSSFQSPAYVSIEMIAAAMGGKPFRWPAGTYVHNHGFDHIMMAMETEITKDGVHYKELNGTPEEEAKLKESYAHLCKLRDEVIEMGVLPAIKDWHSINPNID